MACSSYSALFHVEIQYWGHVRFLNFTHFISLILSSCPAGLKYHPFKIEEYIFPFSLLLLNSIISRILRAVYHIMKYRQPCKPPTYYIFFLSPRKQRGLSVFICFPRQTAFAPLRFSSRCTCWMPL